MSTTTSVTNQPSVWGSITSGASSVANAVSAGAKKVGQFAMTVFQWIGNLAVQGYNGACTLAGKAYSAGASGVALAKENPYVAGGIIAGIAAIGIGALLYNRCCGASA